MIASLADDKRRDGTCDDPYAQVMRSVVVTGIALAVAAGPSPAKACQFVEPQPYSIDPAEQAIDKTPPTKPSVEVGPVHRGMPFGYDAACETLGGFRFSVAAHDDRTEAKQLGWTIEVVAGDSPVALPNPLATREGVIYFAWFERSADTPPLEVTYRVYAVDRAGNRSQPSDLVIVRHPGFDRSKPGPESRELAESACLQGEADSCVWAAKHYVHGLGVAPDRERATVFYQHACALDVPYACDLIADPRRLGAYERHCARGDVTSCRALFLMFRDGRAVDKDFGEALRQLGRACQAGDDEACMESRMYDDIAREEARLTDRSKRPSILRWGPWIGAPLCVLATILLVWRRRRTRAATAPASPKT